VIATPDEMDIANAAELARALQAASNGPPAIIADMSATDFCDAGGLRALLQASRTATANGSELRIAAPTPLVRRVLALTGLDRDLRVFATLTEAAAPAAPATSVTSATSAAPVTSATPAARHLRHPPPLRRPSQDAATRAQRPARD
jgi:anti-anti-sigma factor